MATGDLIRELFSSYKQGDDEQFRAIAHKIIEEERNKNHNILARDLERIIEQSTPKTLHRASPNWQKLPTDRESGVSLVDIKESTKSMRDIILDENLSTQIELIIKEYKYRERLYAYGLSPKRKLLFAGLPGTGKTLLCEVLATELNLPILYTRFDSVVSSYLGETAANLRKIFDFASKGKWIVFFDEFDAIGKSREDQYEHGELKRVVNTFLQLLDNFESESLFVAATNHENLLDRALWRRFDDILFFSLPDKNAITSLIKLKLRNLPHSVEYKKYASELSGWSQSDIELACIDAVKRSILEDSDEVTDTIFESAVRYHQRRMEVIAKTASNQQTDE